MPQTTFTNPLNFGALVFVSSSSISTRLSCKTAQSCNTLNSRSSPGGGTEKQKKRQLIQLIVSIIFFGHIYLLLWNLTFDMLGVRTFSNHHPPTLPIKMGCVVAGLLFRTQLESHPRRASRLRQ